MYVCMRHGMNKVLNKRTSCDLINYYFVVHVLNKMHMNTVGRKGSRKMGLINFFPGKQKGKWCLFKALKQGQGFQGNKQKEVKTRFKKSTKI